MDKDLVTQLYEDRKGILDELKERFNWTGLHYPGFFESPRVETGYGRYSAENCHARFSVYLFEQLDKISLVSIPRILELDEATIFKMVSGREMRVNQDGDSLDVIEVQEAIIPYLTARLVAEGVVHS